MCNRIYQCDEEDLCYTSPVSFGYAYMSSIICQQAYNIIMFMQVTEGVFIDSWNNLYHWNLAVINLVIVACPNT